VQARGRVEAGVTVTSAHSHVRPNSARLYSLPKRRWQCTCVI